MTANQHVSRYCGDPNTDPRCFSVFGCSKKDKIRAPGTIFGKVGKVKKV
jgi:hypothetical protein